MSRDDWSFLEHLLEEGQEYSTSMGRVWLTVLFLFRMLVLGTAAESAWDDEQADFVCNTQQPGCTAVCYDRAFPISHFRYFVLQVIFVSTPTIFYCGYVVVQAREDDGKEVSGAGDGEEETAIAQGGAEAEREDKNERVQEEDKREAVKGLKEGNAVPMVPKLKGGLLGAYAFSILLTFLLEAGFIAGLWVLYGGFVIAAKFECVASPCPHTVDCFASRPTEKTIFTIYTQAIAAVSLLLNLVELFHLLQLAVSHRLEKRYSAKGLTVQSWRVEAPGQAAQVGGATSYRERSHLYLPMGGEGAGHSVPCDGYVEVRAEVNWVPGEAADDLLPTYLNCMGGLGGMRSAHSPRAHHKKHAHGNGKHSNGKHSNGKHSNGKHSPGAHRGHPKQKHYV